MAGPADQQDHIERIVRDVLARLGENNTATNGQPVEGVLGSTGRPPIAEAKPQDARRPERLVLPDRLITLSVLAGRLDGVQEVGVQPAAIVTPAASDALRERGIRLSRNAHPSGDTQQQAGSLVVGVAACDADAVSSGRLQQALGVPLEHVARVGLVEVVRELTEHVVLGGKKGLLFTAEPAAALCLANRRRGVRAIGGRNVDEVRRSAESVAANLLIVQPDGLSTWQQIEVARCFVKCCHAVCPEAYRDALA